MANYRKFKVNEVGTDTYVDYEANVSQCSSKWKNTRLVLVSKSPLRLCFPSKWASAELSTQGFVFSPGEDVCAISYDNGNIRLYSTYNNHLKLVKGQSERMLLFLSYKLSDATLVIDPNSQWRQSFLSQNLHVILNVSLLLLGSVIVYYVLHRATRRLSSTTSKQAKKSIYYVDIRWVCEACVNCKTVHVSRSFTIGWFEEETGCRCTRHGWSRFDC